MGMKHDAHPLLLDPASTLLVGCAPPFELDKNLVDVCVSMAGPVVLVVETRAVVVGATGAAVEVGTKVVDGVEAEDEGGGVFVLVEEEDVDGGGAGVEVVTGGGGVEEGGLEDLCWSQSGQSMAAHSWMAHGRVIGGPAQGQ